MCLVFFILLTPAVFTQTGVKAGFTISNFYGPEADFRGTEHEYKTGGISFCLFSDFRIYTIKQYDGFWSIGTELGYSNKGAIIRNFPLSSLDPQNPVDDLKISVYDYEFAVLLKYSRRAFKNTNINIGAGPSIEFSRQYSEKFLNYKNYDSFDYYQPVEDGSINNVDYCINILTELVYKKVLIDVKYTRGFSRVSLDQDDGERYNTAFIIRLGFIF